MKRYFRKSLVFLLASVFFCGMIPELSLAVKAEEKQAVPSWSDYLRIMDIDNDFAIRVLPDGSFEALVDEYVEAEMLRYEIEGDTWATHYTEEEYREIQENAGHRSSYEQLRRENNYVAVSANCYGTYALLREDGTVALNEPAERRLDYGDGDCSDEYKSWTDIVDVKLGGYSLLGLKEDGTVEFSEGQLDMTEGTPVDEWRDVVAIENNDIILGLKKDGTVYYWHDYDPNENTPYPDEDLSLRAIEEWTDIVQLSVGYFHVIGVKSDGTVVAAGDNHCGQCDVEDWTDIVQVATSQCHTVGLKKDGTVVAVGEAEAREYGGETGRLDVGHLKDVAAVYANDYYTVAVHTDGRIEIVGEWPEEYTQWRNADIVTSTVGTIEKWSPLIYQPQEQNISDENTNSIEEKTSELSDIDHVVELFPFRNGMSVVREFNRNTSEDHVKYISWDGSLALEHEINSYYWLVGNITFVPGEESLLLKGNEGFQLTDSSGNTLRTFSDDDYEMISAPRDGLIMAVEAGEEDQLYKDIVYFDERGNEVLRIQGYSHLGMASSFGDGRAFVCRISDETALSEYSLGSGWPVDWMIIDPAGNMKPLYFANPEKFTDASFRAKLKDLAEGMEWDRMMIKGYILSEVRPFVEGEEYAAGIVKVFYKNYDMNWKKEDTYMMSMDVPAYISRDGGIYLSDYVTYRANVSCCINGCILEVEEDVIIDVNNGTVIRIEELPLFKSIEEEHQYCYVHNLNFLDDGNFFFMINDTSNGDVGVIIRPDGEIVEEPRRFDVKPVHVPYYTDTYREMLCFSGSWHDWQTVCGGLTVELPRNGLYPIRGTIEYEDSPYCGVNGWGFSDIWGEIVIPPEYMLVSQFENGCALACKTKIGELYSSQGYRDLVIIDAQGNEISSIAPPQNKDHSYTPLLADDPYTMDAIQEKADIILNTDTQFKRATNMATLPVVAGETMGYLYDIATFDVPGLIKHVYSDATRQYREDAAWIIAKSLIGEYDPVELSYAARMIREYAESDEREDINDAQKFLDKMTKCLEKGTDDPDLQWYYKKAGGKVKLNQKLLKGFKILGKFMEETEVSMDEQLVLYLLTCNYSSNLEYLEESIAACEGKNEEMAAIYRMILEAFDEYYHQYLQNSAKCIKAFGLSDLFFSEASFDLMTWILSFEQIDAKDALKAVNIAMMKSQGYNEAYSKEITNAYFLVHSLAVSFAEEVGTDDTYDLMQDLYENAIVLNSMVSELSMAKTSSYGSKSNLVNKAIALGEYRLIVLDNVAKYHDACYSGEVFLDVSDISFERMQIRDALNWLRKVPLG